MSETGGSSVSELTACLNAIPRHGREILSLVLGLGLSAESAAALAVLPGVRKWIALALTVMTGLATIAFVLLRGEVPAHLSRRGRNTDQPNPNSAKIVAGAMGVSVGIVMYMYVAFLLGTVAGSASSDHFDPRPVPTAVFSGNGQFWLFVNPFAIVTAVAIVVLFAWMLQMSRVVTEPVLVGPQTSAQRPASAGVPGTELFNNSPNWPRSRLVEKVVPWSGTFIGALAGLILDGLRWLAESTPNVPTGIRMCVLPVAFGLLFAAVKMPSRNRLFGRVVAPDLLAEIDRRFWLFLWILMQGLFGVAYSRYPMALGILSGVLLDVARTQWFRSAASRVFSPIFGGTSGRPTGQQ